MTHVFGNTDLQWDAHTVRARGRKFPKLQIVPDATYPGMWRVQYPDGRLSDMVNKTRAKDAAKSILLAILNRDTRRLEQATEPLAAEPRATLAAAE